MKIRSCRGRWLVSTGAGVLTMTSSLAAQPPASPWTQAVPLPTACYTSQDQFREENAAALEAAKAEVTSRKSGNDQILHNLSAKAAEDPMAMAARMQEQMMKDPQAAIKLMQQSGATEPEAFTAEAQQMIDKTLHWQAEEKDLITRYGAAAQAALAPARAQFAALRKKLGITEGWGVGEGEGGAPPWAYTEYDQIKRVADQNYAAFCPQWWGPTGKMQAFMLRYKTYLVSERIPYYERDDSRHLATYAMQGASTESYKSTAALDAVVDYMKLAGRLYEERDGEPRCAGSTCMDISGI